MCFVSFIIYFFLFIFHFYAFSVILFFLTGYKKQTDGLKNSSNQYRFLFFVIFDTHSMNTMKSNSKLYTANVLDIFFECVFATFFILFEAFHFQFPSLRIWANLLYSLFSILFLFFLNKISAFTSHDYFFETRYTNHQRLILFYIGK